MLKWIARIVLIFVAGSVLWVMAYRFINPPTTMTMIGAWMDGRKIHREWLPLPEIDRDMARAAIAAEDSRFCSHWGFDLEAIGKAVERNRQGRKLRGGSTIRRSEEHTSELQSLMRISYAVFCLKKQKTKT